MLTNPFFITTNHKKTTRGKTVMNIAIVSKFDQTDPKILEHVSVAGLSVTDQNPDVVLCHGGDGTLLIAERKYPGVPKLLIKNSAICKKCVNYTIEDALAAIRKKSFKTEDLIKIKAQVGNKHLLGVNDIVVRNTLPIHALRFELTLDGEKFEQELIGDGIVVATPFGAGAYYYSIAKRGFNKGLGLAFNNLTTDMDHFNFEDTKLVEITVNRGDAIVIADNNPETITVKPGDKILIRKAEETAKIITLN